MKLGFKRGQKGFTLVELMVVMGILAVLASIVFPAVSGTSEVAGDSQVKQDASTVNTAVSDYFADQTGAEIFTTNTTTILGTSASQVITSRWPEKYLTMGYLKEFPLAVVADNTTAVVGAVTITDASGNTTAITAVILANGYNAINLSALATASYIPAVPKSATELSGDFHNYLWLVKKTTAFAESGTVESRTVTVYKLSKVEQNETTKKYTLYYEWIY